MKICLVTSRGGHLFQLYQFKGWWKRYDRFWVTDKGGDSEFLLRKEKVYYGFFPENRNVLNALRNLCLGLKLILKERPDLLVSTGAGIAPPFFLIGKILGLKLIFLEPYDFIEHPSLSGRLVCPITDRFFVQHEEQRKFFPKAEFLGTAI